MRLKARSPNLSRVWLASIFCPHLPLDPLSDLPHGGHPARVLGRGERFFLDPLAEDVDRNTAVSSDGFRAEEGSVQRFRVHMSLGSLPS